MSNISQFGGGSIKSIQRGVINIASGTSATATITSVNTSKTKLSYLGGTGTESSTAAYNAPRIVLTNSTTITATCQSASHSGSGAYVSWELTEFY